MAADKSIISGNTSMLLLKLLEENDMYGYEMIEELKRRSQDIFTLKAGTLYPLLHTLEENGMVTSYEKLVDRARVRKYYSITSKGKKNLLEKENEWRNYTKAINNVLKGGVAYGTI